MAAIASASFLALSVVTSLLTILLALRVMRDKGWWLLWLLLTGSLVALSLRRLLSPSQVARWGFASLDAELDVAIAFAVLMLLGVYAMRRLMNEVARLRGEKSESENAVQGLVANLPIVVSLVHESGGVRFLNPASITALTGYPADRGDNTGPWLALLRDSDQAEVEKALRRAFEGETLHLAVRFRHRDASWRWAEILFHPLRQDGIVTAVTTMTSDVTEKRLLGDQLREAQKMEALGAMGSGMAHDFNNLLASIQGNLELAGRKTGRGHAAERNLAEAAKAAQRATEHCRQILGFSRKSVLDPQPVDLNEVCREALALLRPTVDPRIEFAVFPQAGLWGTVGEAGEIVQALVNLLLNARDVLPAGGHVVLETTNVVLDGSQGHHHPDAHAGEYVRLNVSDDGPGMSPEVQARIFEPFFSTKLAGQGTGLGLAMVYGTARRHGGWVQCLSQPGLGTSFSLYFPRRQAAGSQTATAADPVRGGSETILLVDDEEALRTIGVEALEDLGYSVITAGDGVEALEVFSREQAKIQLVILDLSMPRMDGRQVLPRLKELDPGVRVLVTTGHSPEAEAQNLLDQGVMGLIPKPYRLEEIGRLIRNALDSDAGRDLRSTREQGRLPPRPPTAEAARAS